MPLTKMSKTKLGSKRCFPWWTPPQSSSVRSSALAFSSRRRPCCPLRGLLRLLSGSGFLPELCALLSVRIFRNTCFSILSLRNLSFFKKGLVYAELGLTLPQAGSDYTYVRETFGDIGGFLVIWVMFWNTGNSIAYNSFGRFFVRLFGPFFAPSKSQCGSLSSLYTIWGVRSFARF